MRNWTTAVLMLSLFSCASGAKKADAECACASDPLVEGKVIRLVTGVDKLVELGFEPSKSGVFIGNPQVLASTLVLAERTQLLLKPLKSGETNVTVMNSKGEAKYQQKFYVTAVDLGDLANQLSDLLKDTKEASVKLQKDKVVIDGNLANVAQAGRIAAITQDRRFADYVLNLTRLSPQFFTDLATRVQDELKKQFPNITVRSMNEQLWLEGKVETLDQSNRAAKMASLMLPEALPADLMRKDPEAETLAPRPRVQNFLTVGK